MFKSHKPHARHALPCLGAVLSILLLGAVGGDVSAQSRRGTASKPRDARTAPPPPAVDVPVPFKAGETLSFDISWSSYFTAGKATLQVKERRANAGGGGSYYLVAEAQPSSMLQRLYSLYYKAESFLDTRTLRPTTATLYSNENGRTRYKLSRFQGNGTVDFEMQTRSTMRTSLKADPSMLDPLSLMYVLRTLPLTAGQPPVTLRFTDSGRLYTLRVAVQGQESVSTGAGPIAATKLGVSVSRTDGEAVTTSGLTLWMSNDARHLPVRMVGALPVGSVQLTLASIAG
jgi:hypothetical protein